MRMINRCEFQSITLFQTVHVDSLVVNSPSQETEETSTPNKTCGEYSDNDERRTRKKNTTIEWDDGEKGN